ncbi:MAG: GvpL/GvpF family gas vesicle protein [Gemmatimonadaceae bacterium]
MALTLHAITLAENGQDEPDVENTSDATRVPFRDLSAVISEQQAFATGEPTPESIAKHRTIVDAAFTRGSVLPAPIGVVFRAPDVLTRWMELHYVSLTSALEYVEGRAVARVHVARSDGKSDDTEPESDLPSQAAEALRAVRRRAVASIPLRHEHKAALPLGAAFLVERDSWKEFLAGVSEQQDAHHLLRFTVTGPWAPYDFVRMVFGG